MALIFPPPYCTTQGYSLFLPLYDDFSLFLRPPFAIGNPLETKKGERYRAKTEILENYGKASAKYVLYVFERAGTT